MARTHVNIGSIEWLSNYSNILAELQSSSQADSRPPGWTWRVTTAGLELTAQIIIKQDDKMTR
jgi:hypothetical protein